MKKTDKILSIMRTKTPDSRAHKKLQKQFVKEFKKEQRARVQSAREYSVSLYKVFKNKLMNFL